MDIVTPYFYPYVGGVQKCVLRLSDALSKLGSDVRIITSDYYPANTHGRSPSNNLPIQRLRCNAVLFELPIIPGVAKTIRKSRAEIIHVNGMYPFFTDIALMAGRISGKATLLNYHFDPVPTRAFLGLAELFYRPMCRVIAKRSDTVVATTTSYVQNSPVLSNLSKRIDIIPNGVEENFFERPEDSEMQRLRASLGIANNDSIILFVGQLKQFKGVDTLLISFKKILDRLKAKLLIVGTGPEETSLKSLTFKLGIQKDVRFLGYVADEFLPIYYHLCDVFVLPSKFKRENFGIAALEAMAASKPVVASRLPGLNEVVSDKITGFLVNPGDDSELREAISTILQQEDLANRMGRFGKDRAVKYRWPQIAEDFLHLYKMQLAS